MLKKQTFLPDSVLLQMTGIGLKCRNCKTGFRAKAMLEEHTAVCVQGQDPEEVGVKKEEKEGTKVSDCNIKIWLLYCTNAKIAVFARFFAANEGNTENRMQDGRECKKGGERREAKAWVCSPSFRDGNVLLWNKNSAFAIFVATLLHLMVQSKPPL